MTEKFTSFEEALREKLDGYNDVVNDSVFAKLQAKRAFQQKLNDASSVVNTDSVFDKLQAKRAFQQKLSDASSEVPKAAIFENIQFKRAFQQKLNNTTADVPSGMFENVGYQKSLQSKIDSATPPVRSVLFDRMQDKRVLQNKLKDFSSPVSADLFDKIQTARKERKPKFAIYYWAAASVAACLVLWFLSLKLQNSNQLNNNNNTIVNTKKAENPNGDIISNKPNTDLNANTGTQKQNAISASDEPNNSSKPEIAKNSTNFEQKDKLASAQNFNKVNKEARKQTNQRNNDAIAGSEKSETLTTKEQTLPSHVRNQQLTKTPLTKEEKTVSDASRNPKKIIVDSSENIAAVVDIAKQPDIVSPSEILNSQNSNSQVKGGSKVLESTSLAAQELNTQLYKKGIKSLKPHSLCGPGDECPSFAGARLRNYVRPSIFFEPFVGGALVNRTLTEKSADYTAYRQKRDSTENAQYAMQAGMMIGYQFRNGFHASTGIRYERISEKATYDSIGVGQISYVITLTTPPDTSAKVLTDGIFRKTRFNTITSFEIPIRLGYTMVLNRYWALDLTASAGFNIATSTKQSVYNPELSLVDNTDISNNYFKKSYGLSAGLTVGVNRALSANTQLIVSAYGNYKTSPVTTTDYVLAQKYSTYGINAAWRYQF